MNRDRVQNKVACNYDAKYYVQNSECQNYVRLEMSFTT